MGLAKGLQCGMDNVANLGPETQRDLGPEILLKSNGD